MCAVVEDAEGVEAERSVEQGCSNSLTPPHRWVGERGGIGTPKADRGIFGFGTELPLQVVICVT